MSERSELQRHGERSELQRHGERSELQRHGERSELQRHGERSELQRHGERSELQRHGAVPDGLLEIGHLRRAHGVRGQINVELSTDRPERVVPGARWFARNGWLTVAAATRHQDRWLVTFDEIADRAVAQRYTNTPAYAEPLDDPDELWVHDVVGAEVLEVDGTSRGRCVAVVENPAADLLELASGALVPVVFVVEQGGGRVVIDPPSGLFEDDEPGPG